MIDDIDKKIIHLIQGDLPPGPEPFAAAADSIGIEEDAILERIHRMKKKGVIRRFGATLRHQEAGFTANAMVAWRAPESTVDETGRRLAEFPEVSHCYRRPSGPDWNYNLYTMVHAKTRKECRRIAKKMSASVGIRDYELLFSEKEFKKTSMKYF